MAVYEFATEEEMDDHAEMIEKVNFKHANLKEEVRDRERALECAEEELRDFEEEEKEFLIAI